MALTGRDKIAIMRRKRFSFLADKHLDRPCDYQPTLVKGMFMAGIFFSGSDLHACHDQIVTNLRMTHNTRTKLLKSQGVHIRENHVFLLTVDFYAPLRK